MNAHARKEREREGNTNVSSAFERKTKRKREERATRREKNQRDRAKRAKSDPILSVFITLLQRRRRRRKKETKRNARTWCNKTCAFSDASAKDAIIAEAKTPKSKLLVDEADMRVYFRLFL